MRQPPALLATAALLLVCSATAARSESGDPRAVRDSVRKLLGSPEFRDLRPLKSKPRSVFRGRGAAGREHVQQDPDGQPVILRDEQQRSGFGRDDDGRAVLRDQQGREVPLRDEQGREFIVRDPDERGVVGRDEQGRPVVVRDDDDRAVIERDDEGRAVVGRDEAGRDVIARDGNGREFVVRDFQERDVMQRDKDGRPVRIRDERGRWFTVRDEQGRPIVNRDEQGRPIIFRDENRRAAVKQDAEGRAIAGRDENGNEVPIRDRRGRPFVPRNEGDGRIVRDEQGRPIIFRDEQGRANVRRDDDGRAIIGRNEQGGDVGIRDGRDREILAREEREWVEEEARRNFGRDGWNLREGEQGEFGRGGNDARRQAGGNPADPAPRSDASSSNGDSDNSYSAPALTGAGNVLSALAQILGWIVGAVVIAVMLFLIVKGFIALIAWYQDRERELEPDSTGPVAGNPLEPDRSPGELPADVYLAKARELAAAGKFKEAIAHLLLGGMSQLERGGAVKYRKGLTHRDYVRAARSQPQIYQAMREMVRLYEPLGFGRRTPAAVHFEQSLAAYESGFRATSTSPA